MTPTDTIEEDSNIILCPDCGWRHHHRADCEEAAPLPLQQTREEASALIDILDNYILDTEDKLAQHSDVEIERLEARPLLLDCEEGRDLLLLRDSLVAAGDALIRIRATMAGDLQQTEQEQS